MRRAILKRGGGYDPQLGRDHPSNQDPTLPPSTVERDAIEDALTMLRSSEEHWLAKFGGPSAQSEMSERASAAVRVLVAESRAYRMLLAAPFPCGHEDPIIEDEPEDGVPLIVAFGTFWSPDDLRGYCAAALRKADECEALADRTKEQSHG